VAVTLRLRIDQAGAMGPVVVNAQRLASWSDSKPFERAPEREHRLLWYPLTGHTWKAPRRNWILDIVV
jgi:hypothetical protein